MEKIKKYINKNIKLLVTFGILGFFFILIAILVILGKTAFIDTSFHTYILHIRNNRLTAFFNIITEFGGASMLLAIGVMSVLLMKKKKVSILLLVNLAFSFLLNETVKSVFMRSRPVGINLIEETGYSFPSGHSMISLSFYGFIGYLIFKNIHNKIIKILSIILLIILVLLIGFSRIYLGVHYLSDVIAGFLLALIYLTLFINIIKKEKM